jgi:hypothetical protein
MKSGKLVAGPLGQNFYAAVMIIAHPASDAQDVRLALDKPAEAHALYTSTNDEPASFYRLFGGSHFRENRS